MKIKYKLNYDAKEKIEQMLVSYPALLDFCDDNAELMEEFNKNGVREKSKDIVGGNIPSGINVSEFEILEAKRYQAHKTWKRVNKICNILKKVEANDINHYKTRTYYSIIDLYYFQGISQQDIANKISLVKNSVQRHRERLLCEIAIRLLGMEAFNE